MNLAFFFKQAEKGSGAERKVLLFSALTLSVIMVALFGEFICPYDPYMQDYQAALQPPGMEHIMGTDRYGRDMLSRVIVGAQISVFSALAVVFLIAAIGTCVGMVCGYRGGILDNVVMRFSDICLAFPGLIFAMAIAAVLNGGVQNAVLALAAISWPKYARLVRSQTLALKEQPFMMAAQMAGNTSVQIMLRHILPNCMGTVLVTAVLDIGTMMMEIAALSFLGLGAKPPAAEWGSMMSSGRSMLQTYPWVVLSPGLGIFIAVSIFNVWGDALRDYMDPSRTGRIRRKER